MSAVASFFLLPVESLPILREMSKRPIGVDDPYWGFLRLNGTEFTYDYSGWLVVTLLCYLEEHHGVELRKSGHDDLAMELTIARHSTQYFLTSDHRDRCQTIMNPDAYDEKELGQYYNDFNQSGDAVLVVGRRMKEAIRVLRDCLAKIDNSTVVLAVVG